jgi:hypothetical protein
MKIVYKATGLCLGNYWGGGCGAYPTITFHSDNLNNLEININKAISDGTIDSGMGFKSMIGAYMTIEKIKSIEIDIDGKLLPFTHIEYSEEFYGKLTDKEAEFLYEVYNNM